MRARLGMTRPDRPWRRPGAVRVCAGPVAGPAAPACECLRACGGLTVSAAGCSGGGARWRYLASECSFAAGGGRYPVLMSAHPAYRKGPEGGCTLHWGPSTQARLLIPVIPSHR